MQISWLTVRSIAAPTLLTAFSRPRQPRQRQAAGCVSEPEAATDGAGLQQDVLANSSRNYQIASLLVYVGLVAFQVPGNILAKRVPRPELYIGLNCIGWGIASSCQAAATNPAGIFGASSS